MLQQADRHSIDRRKGLTQREFEAEYVSRSRPVILTDATDHWPARQSWNFDYFQSKFADKVVNFDKRDWKLGEFIRELRAAVPGERAPYLKNVKLREQFPELWPDVFDHPHARNDRLHSRLLPRGMRIDRGVVAVFMGTRGSGFRDLHWDYSYLHVFISQIQGAKDAILFSPDDSAFLYPKADVPNISLIPDPFEVDPARFPLFSKASPIRITICSGETLFVPAGWWHATSIPEPSIAVAESTFDRFNWEQRKRWYLDLLRDGGVSFARRQLLSIYLSFIDKLFRVAEALKPAQTGARARESALAVAPRV